MARRKIRASVRPRVGAATNILWAPWRAAYVSGEARRTPGCVFCVAKIPAGERKRRFVLYGDAYASVLLNIYPYNSGHLMVAPRRHVAEPEELNDRERSALFDLLFRSVNILRRAMHPEGFNLGANLGRAAGAGIADHMHWHVVPRWNGDNNFMPILASTRVLSQHLKTGFALLEPFFKSIAVTVS